MLLSVIIPIFNESQGLNELVLRLRSSLQATCENWEVLFVDDGSSDNSLALIKALHNEDPRFKVLALSRNFGHQIAITAGLDKAKGDAIAVLDADLQDPPELLKDMLKKLEEGYDVTYGVRRHRDGESAFKLITANVFYRLLQKITKIDIPVDTGDFRMINRRVANELIRLREQHRFVRGLVSWVGYKQIAVPYDRAERYAGQSKYPLTRMIKFAWDGITSFSTAPLKIASWAGAFTILIGLIYSLHIFYLHFFAPESLERGWASLVILLFFFSGTQLLLLGIIGQYIGRIADEVKNRPLYHIDSFEQ